MSTFLSEDILNRLTGTRHRKSRGPQLTVRAGGRSWSVVRATARGFVMERGARPLPGRVDLYDGERHVVQGLAVRGEEADGEIAYEFKWRVAPRPTAPLDFAMDADPDFDGTGAVALIAR